MIFIVFSIWYGCAPNEVNTLYKKKIGSEKEENYSLKNNFLISFGIAQYIICTTVSADVVLSFKSHSFVMPTQP